MRTLPQPSVLSLGMFLAVMAPGPATFAEEVISAAPRQGKLEFKAEPVTISTYLREPNSRHPRLAFKVGGEMAKEVRAARIIVTRATDDTGRELQGPTKPTFFRTAVGSSSEKEFRGPIPPDVACDLSPVAPEATKLKMVEGRVELVIPAKSRNATVIISDVPSHTGIVESDALRQAGITLEIYDQAAYDARMASYRNQTGGFTEYGMGVMFPESITSSMSAETRAELQKHVDEQLQRSPLPKLTKRDVALALSDPEQRLIGYEFFAGERRGLIYNRNGWAHYETAAGKRLDIFRLQEDLPADLKLVCWLAINESMVVIPFEMIDIPLPPPRDRSAPAVSSAGSEKR
jgi:hypothetical protein